MHCLAFCILFVSVVFSIECEDPAFETFEECSATHLSSTSVSREYCECFEDFPSSCVEGVEDECDWKNSCEKTLSCLQDGIECSSKSYDPTAMNWHLCDCAETFYSCIEGHCGVEELYTLEHVITKLPCDSVQALAKRFWEYIESFLFHWIEERSEDFIVGDGEWTDEGIVFPITDAHGEEKEEKEVEESIQAFCTDLANYYNDLLREDCEKSGEEICRIEASCTEIQKQEKKSRDDLDTYDVLISFESGSSGLVVSIAALLSVLAVFFF
eukprot:TRINITY_DN15726_c0_g1_i1.p1 TRINITY_DN15726_c0_g1~~TRINITY_DN15726_c0_g1_i1.p1  ORF type:complete len:270 (+),score=79.46 TRINITY_DN15726_c0_g1_i1:13-822(+)